MTKVWVLTQEYNDYDQYGEYFVAVFATKPTAKQLMPHTGWYEWAHEHLLDGGRVEWEDNWYYLREVEAE